MNSLYFRSVIGMLLALALVSCRNGDSTDIGNEMAFAWYNSRDYTNIYNGGDPSEGGVPVLPGGCDYAKWNDRYVLTKGEHWRYANWPKKYHITTAPADGFHYFVLDKKTYGGGQEGDAALHGPLTQAELVEWERRIPGQYKQP